ncbi:hypothetical protein GKE82_26030 [Conexibacter sp. W3-3-2]|uniref:hypothetical protein n=1 Tax=Conexibacter sp. W3-3-2 TaxID=2675227 RepID=UPI0012BA1EE7|nr:hypothetical protein [Conexibacter sp. W3-3-2]MTD47664.1 hypothetical protein [Conexibacter sp. W3-3-2]
MARRSRVQTTEGAVRRRPLQFVIYSPDGVILDVFDDEDLATFDPAQETRCWHEAACWAVVANARYRECTGPPGTLV